MRLFATVTMAMPYADREDVLQNDRGCGKNVELQQPAVVLPPPWLH